MGQGFEGWIASLGLDEADEDAGGPIGPAPAGRDDFLREVFDTQGGPVSVDILEAAWHEREVLLATRAAALVEADVRRTTVLTPRIEVQTVMDDVVAVTYNGNYQTPVILSIREPESICEVADNLRVEVMNDLWTVWPTCASHGGVLDPISIKGEAVWHCSRGGHAVSEIGRL